MTVSNLILALAATCLTCSTPFRSVEPSEHSERVERRLVALGTWLEIDLTAIDRATALEASEAAVRAIEGVEARLSTWRDGSELAQVNAQAVGQPLAISPELSGWLTRSRAWCERTDGLFDPTLGELVVLWGLRDGGLEASPEPERIEAARLGVGLAAWSLAEEHVTRLRKNVRFEEGAFGKGAALEAGLAAARAAGAVTIKLDLGGQLAFLGRAATVGVAHPQDRERVVVTLTREGGSFATTGNSERGILVGGKAQGHVLDPRTGRPGADWGSLTVWAQHALDADALSTGLYLMGPAEAIRWADATAGVEAVAAEHPTAIDQRVRLHATSAFASSELDSSLAHFAHTTQPKPTK